MGMKRWIRQKPLLSEACGMVDRKKSTQAKHISQDLVSDDSLEEGRKGGGEGGKRKFISSPYHVT